MTRRILIPLIAAAIALSPVAAVPARADSDDLAKAILGAAAAYAIVKGIENSNDRRDARRVDRDWRDDRGYHDGRTWRERHRVRTIPEDCVRSIDTRRGPRTVATERCLRREGVGQVPDRCALRLRDRGRNGDAYGVRCLQESGFVVEARRR